MSEYGIQLQEYEEESQFPNEIDYNYIRFPGWKEDNICIRKYFSPQTVRTVSYKITQLLQGVDKQNRPIIVPDKTIHSVMNDIYTSYRPQTGDIYGRYNVPKYEPENHVQNMIDQVIEVITADVRANLGMQQCNEGLSVWTTVLGDFNEHGLQQHSKIKIRERNTSHRGMVSFMNY
jgi:hypothetical protein